MGLSTLRGFDLAKYLLLCFIFLKNVQVVLTDFFEHLSGETLLQNKGACLPELLLFKKKLKIKKS